jgi:hypothetical protein
VWDKWAALQRASVIAEVPFDALPALHAGIEMLYGADLQWDRFKQALSAERELPYRWSVEMHFFLIAADNARDRLVLWGSKVADAEVTGILARLDVPGLKDFRHHQEHLEERLPGGPRDRLAQLPAPGNSMIRVEAGEVFAFNYLSDGRYLHFGQEVLDVRHVHQSIVETGSHLLEWLEGRSRLPRLAPGGEPTRAIRRP